MLSLRTKKMILPSSIFIFLLLFSSLVSAGSLGIGYNNLLIPHINKESQLTSNFLSLTDTPSSYSGSNGLCVIVNPGETGLTFGSCSAGSGDNATWSEARANTLYTPITWNYNQSDGSYNASYYLNTNPNGYYNITTLPAQSSVTNGTILSISNITNFLYNYNQSATIYYYNQSASCLALGSYNGTIIAEANVTNRFNYSNSLNTTYVIGMFNWSNTGNTTFLINLFNWSNTANTTYIISIFNWSNTINQSIITNYTTGALNKIPSCSAGQVLTNISGLSCVADATGSTPNNGITINSQNISNINRQMVLTKPRITTVNGTGWTVNVFNWSLTKGANYTLNCNLFTSSNVTTTGVQFNLSSNVSFDWLNADYSQGVSATGFGNNGCGNNNLKECVYLSATSYAFPSASSTRLTAIIFSNTTIAQTMNLTMKSEVVNSNASIHYGSWCDLQQISP